MIKHKVFSTVVTGAIMLATLAPAAFAAQIDEVGNGAVSHNQVNLTQNDSSSLQQTNNSTITNDVTSNANSGNNGSSFNTGGSSMVFSGPATSNVDISNRAGENQAFLPMTNSEDGRTSVLLGNNGAFSDNTANVTTNNNKSLSQQNNTSIDNNVNANTTSGGNTSSFNTGGSQFGLDGMRHWNDMNSVFLNQNGWKWDGNCWRWKDGSNNFPDWWNNWFMTNGWNWNNGGWNWNGNNSVQSGQAQSNVSLDNAAGSNMVH